MRSGRAGFTLVEVMVGLTVAALALAAGFVALGAVHDRGEHAAEASRAAVAGAAQRALLVEWLAGARQAAPSGEMFEGAREDAAGEPVDLLLFPTTARTPAGGMNSVVLLYIDHDADTPERGLVAEVTGSTPGQPPRRVELVPEAVHMRVRYLGTGSTSGEWQEEWAGRNELPRLIEITLTAAPGDSLPLLLRLPIRVAPGGRL
jgi:prepilin-type N-terminal cleavage/methylation domain-containing protein